MEDYTRDLTHVRYAKRYWIKFEHELDQWIDRLVNLILEIQKKPTRWPTPPFKESPLYSVLQEMKGLFQEGWGIRAIVEALKAYNENTMFWVVGYEIERELTHEQTR